jgi:cystathionine beta-lyase/cystathionine gamma-synthase
MVATAHESSAAATVEPAPVLPDTAPAILVLIDTSGSLPSTRLHTHPNRYAMRKAATRLVERYQPPAAAQLPVAPPIVQSTTFVIDDALNAAMDAGDYRSQFLYTRMGNPTIRGLEELLASLHGAEDCVATASGMGALSAFFFALVPPGGTVIADTQVYGVTATLLRNFLVPAGRHVTFVPFAQPEQLQAAIRNASGTVWLLGETISNPLIHTLDIERTAQIAHDAGARLAIDNTFANPLVCRPLDHGADLVIESLSKSVAGHSDVHGGAVLGASSLIDPCWQAMYVLGACLDPHAAWLIQRGARTLALRTTAACANARSVAHALRNNPHVEHVYFTQSDDTALPEGLRDTGAMMSFVVRGGDQAAHAVLGALRIATAATSLGGVETLASLPYNTSHRTPEARASVGLQPGTIRLSVGCEDAEELIEDLRNALAHSR